jgi:hypothetical protein
LNTEGDRFPFSPIRSCRGFSPDAVGGGTVPGYPLFPRQPIHSQPRGTLTGWLEIQWPFPAGAAGLFSAVAMRQKKDAPVIMR